MSGNKLVSSEYNIAELPTPFEQTIKATFFLIASYSFLFDKKKLKFAI